MKKILSFFLLACLVFGMVGASFESAVDVSAVSSHIHKIVTNPAEDCSTSMNINFHADTGYTACIVQYTTADDTSFANAMTATGTYKSYGASESSNPFYNKYAKNDSGSDYYQTPTFLDYSVTITGLTPDTNYIYRISDGSAYSNTYSFKTAGTSGDWSFVVTGDFHEYYANYGAKRAAQATKAINAAVSLAGQKGYPAVEHIVSVGDIVAHGSDYNQWQNVYNQSWVKNYSFASAVGNHDAMDRSASYKNDYNAIMANYPLNGYSAGLGTCFYYVYNNVLFIFIDYATTSATAQSWVDSVCSSMQGQYKYSILVNHRPAMSKYTGKPYYSYFWDAWADNCDKNKIDLVLAGDHHVYMRSYPIVNGSKLSGYSASNPDATVYIAADSADGERGVSTSDTSFGTSQASALDFSSYLASNYFRYDYTSSTKDITALLIHVGEDKITTNIVYYENSGTAANSSDFYEGSVSGHSYFYYGDTSYVYPSDHGYDPSIGETDPNVPVAAKDYFAAANGGKYMYDTTTYPGGSSYYTYAYYGDASNQGGSYITGKLNDGVLPADSNPGSSNENWSVFFLSNGNPTITMQLSEAVYLNNIAFVYRVSGNYGNAAISSIQVSENGSSFKTTSAYTVSSGVSSGANYKATAKFNSAVKAKVIKITLNATDAGTRLAIGEMYAWGDTALPEGAGLPSSKINFAAKANGATYMYPTTIYPGGTSYAATAHYGDNGNTGGNYFAGKLNDGTVPADSNPGTANEAWATWFTTHGTPEVTFKLSETGYLSKMTLVFRDDIAAAGFYGDVLLGSLQVSQNGTSFRTVTDYDAKVTLASGSNNKLTVSFKSIVQASYVKFTIAAPSDGATRFAVGEVEIWGDTTLPEGAEIPEEPFELVENSTYKLDEAHVQTPTELTSISALKAQFACEVKVYSAAGTELADDAIMGTGCIVKKYNTAGDLTNEVIVIMPGDISGDGSVDTSDYVAAKSLMTGTVSFGAPNEKAADATKDGVLGTSDYILIKGHCIGTHKI